MKRLFLIINEDRFFLSHRSPIAEEAVKDGWHVTLVTKDTGKRAEIERLGYDYIELPINPTGMNPADELKTFRFLYKLIRHNPDAIIHLVGLKNMMWGGLAARFAKAGGIVFAVSGLGTLFGENKSYLISKGVQFLMKRGMRNRNIAVIFQNHDDQKLFKENGIFKNGHEFFIKGSGVNLDEYSYSAPDEDNPVIKIIFTARMLREKGVEDLVAAAELLRKDYEGRVEFLLCGGLSDNPNALSEEEMNKLCDGKYIKWLGHRNDVADLLKSSHIVCFPSYYREGVPKSLIEASASGRPIVTTNSVGCRDTVEEGKNGFIVEPHSPDSIASALRLLIENKELRREMGVYSRKLSERDYDIKNVTATHLKIYNLLNAGNRKKKD